MSTIHASRLQNTPELQQTSNLPSIPPNPHIGMYYYVYCLHEKPDTEFSPDELLLATSSPLRDVTNELNTGQKKHFGRNKIKGPTYIVCREKQKRRNQARRMKADETKQWKKLSWKEIVRMIEDGFSFCMIVLIIDHFHPNNFSLFLIFSSNSHPTS